MVKKSEEMNNYKSQYSGHSYKGKHETDDGESHSSGRTPHPG